MWNKYKWPWYPTIGDILAWELELQDMDATVGITRVGIQLYHVECSDSYTWDSLEHMMHNGLGNT